MSTPVRISLAVFHLPQAGAGLLFKYLIDGLTDRAPVLHPVTDRIFLPMIRINKYVIIAQMGIAGRFPNSGDGAVNPPKRPMGVA